MPVYQPYAIRAVAFNAAIATDWTERLKRGVKPAFQPSEQQEAIMRAFTDTDANLVIEALAGTGKSSTMELLMYALALGNVGGRAVDRSAGTTHGLGKASVDSAMHRPRIDKFKPYKHLDTILPPRLRDHELSKTMQALIIKLASLCKANLVQPDPDTLDAFMVEYGLSLGRADSAADTTPLIEQCFEYVPTLLEACRADTRSIDFDDMLWFPIVHNLEPIVYDVLMGDETQDWNACQIELVLRSGLRHVLVGDKNQAIYGFRGADYRAMQTLTARLAQTQEGVTVLPLTVTRRCPQSVVTLAQQLVPSFEAAPDAPTGQVLTCHPSEAPELGDMVLCRTNAPLIKGAYACLASKVPARIQGKDIGQGLKRLIGDLAKPTDTLDYLYERIDLWASKERAKLTRASGTIARHADAKLEAIEDKQACLLALCDAPFIATVADVLQSIDSLFDDKTPTANVVTFSSVHRAKGLEATVVRILEPEKMPHPMARTPQAMEQERNVLYVAITRSKSVLVFHGQPTLRLAGERA